MAVSWSRNADFQEVYRNIFTGLRGKWVLVQLLGWADANWEGGHMSFLVFGEMKFQQSSAWQGAPAQISSSTTVQVVPWYLWGSVARFLAVPKNHRSKTLVRYLNILWQRWSGIIAFNSWPKDILKSYCKSIGDIQDEHSQVEWTVPIFHCVKTIWL